MNQSIKKVTVLASVPIFAIVFVAVVSSVQANALTTTTTVSSAIGSIITLLTSSGTVNLDSTPTPTGVQTIASDTITVSTNDAAGYTLKLNETSAASALVSGGNSIPATAGTFGTPIAEVANTWGYRVDSLGTFGAGPTTGAANAAIGAIKFAAVPATASPQTLKTTATTATNDTTTVWYGVAVSTATPSGTYTNSVTYTALAN
ncbi:MAG: exported protein of unknown function [Candidatus Saccharibacteria bacterium]|nr:exported protein of unknown function [Candidatus Saccharibacteria bacterium]